MIVCVEGEKSNPANMPGFGLIEDPVVAYACGMALYCPNLKAAEARLKNILDPTKYVVGRGGSHVYVNKIGCRSVAANRLAMLFDSNDRDAWSMSQTASFNHAQTLVQLAT